METKEIKITPPEGYEIDKENSTLECIKFKKKLLTYEDVEFNLFNKSGCCFIDDCGRVKITVSCKHPNPSCGVTIKQLEKLLAINKLLNVAKYLNGDWKPELEVIGYDKWYIQLDKDEIEIAFSNNIQNYAIVYFKTEELAQQAIDILGEDTIKLALSTDW